MQEKKSKKTEKFLPHIQGYMTTNVKKRRERTQQCKNKSIKKKMIEAVP